MSVALLARIERDLCRIGEELWNIDGPDNDLDTVLERVSSLKARLQVQKSLQATANLLRRIPSDKALPNQQGTKVKRLVRFAFQKNHQQKPLGRGDGTREGRRQKLRKLDCDAFKLCGLSYTIEEIIKLGDAEFEILQDRTAEFLRRRDLSYLLYRSDVDKAVYAKLEDPEDDELFDNFIISHTTQRLSTRKRKHDAIASRNEAAQGKSDIFDNPAVFAHINIAPANNHVAPHDEEDFSQTSKKTKTNTESSSHGDVFALTREDARYALCSDQDVRSIFLTNPDLEVESSFLTAWVSKEMGIYLGERGQRLDYKYSMTKSAEGLRESHHSVRLT